jgi:hypothetical protein
MQQPIPDATIASASEGDYGDLIALLEAASLPTEDLERSSMAISWWPAMGPER